jgi:formiminotetrahydrofolate cyclodeaminase
MLTNKTVNDLLDAFSSTDPTPGGGSASALAGAIAASLLAMVAGMPKTRLGTAEERAALDAARAKLLALRATLVDLVDRDAAAYDLVVAAFKKPKGTDEEKAARKAAIQDATRVATETPLETMRACVSLVREAGLVASYGNPSASSDVKTGVHLAMAGLQGARHNVEINLGSLTDAGVVAGIRQELEQIGRDLGGHVAGAFPKA